MAQIPGAALKNKKNKIKKKQDLKKVVPQGLGQPCGSVLRLSDCKELVNKPGSVQEAGTPALGEAALSCFDTHHCNPHVPAYLSPPT